MNAPGKTLTELERTAFTAGVYAATEALINGEADFASASGRGPRRRGPGPEWINAAFYRYLTRRRELLGSAASATRARP